MKSVKRIFAALLISFTVFFGGTANALTNEEYKIYSDNHIYFYDAQGCSVGASNLNSYNNLVIGESHDSTLTEVVKQYGLLAMDLQREYGTPWEVVFAQMEMESNVGRNKNSIAGAVEANGYYNWLGITGKGGQYSVGVPYVSSSGREWAQYPSVENMIKAWAGEYIARNGYYDKAFTNNLDPNSYNLRGFLNDFIMVYAPPSENDTSRYITSVMSFINGSIKEAREEMGWPSAEELARQENIPIGGRHPLGGGSSSDSSSSSGCTKLTSSPDYNDSGYKGRLSNLHNFSQTRSMFKDYKMREGESYTMYWNGCGIMSVYAAYYMFSGQGLNDANVFNSFLANTRADSGYNLGYASDVPSMGSNTLSFMQANKTVLFDYGSYSTAGDRWSELVSALQRGNKILILVSKDDGSIFANSGHYLLLDHYNAEKNMIYMFDPAMGDNRSSTVSQYSSDYIEPYEGSAFNGMYVSQRAMNEIVKPKEATALSYDGCFTGGSYSSIMVNVCRASSIQYSPVGLTTGGMTYDEAVNFIAAYRAEASKRKRGDYGSGYANGSVIGNGWIYDAGVKCADGTLNNCSALSQWFVNNYTTIGPNTTSWHGGKWVAQLIKLGFQDGGRVPSPYAVFSKPSGSTGHTGIILGVNEDKNEVYVAEAGCNGGFITTSNGKGDWPGVHIKSLSELTNGVYTYAYPGNLLKLERQ